jgi:hypothetical protein
VVSQRTDLDEQTPAVFRAGMYVLLLSGILIALVAAVVGVALLIADLNGTFDQLTVMKQVHGH